MKPRPDLAIEIVDGELVILDKAAGKVHQLNASATFVWHGISDGLGAEAIALKLSKEFDVGHGTASTDVRAAIAEFRTLLLIDE